MDKRYYLCCPECECSNISREMNSDFSTQLYRDPVSGIIDEGKLKNLSNETYYLCNSCGYESEVIETFLLEESD